MKPLPQKELAALLGGGCFLRKAREDDALFVSDAPRRFSEEKLLAIRDTLAKNGFRCELAERGLWKIDLSEERFSEILMRYRHDEPASFPADDRYREMYALARLLSAHPAPWTQQPQEPLRALLKRIDQPLEMRRIVPQTLEYCAQRLRNHQPLPSAAAGMLYQWLRETGKE